MEIITQLTQSSNNPQWPGRPGDGARVIVEFPFDESFYELVNSIHDQAFKLQIDQKKFECVLNQGGTPIAMIFPDAQASPPIVSMKLLVYCDMEDILEIKKSEVIKLIIN